MVASTMIASSLSVLLSLLFFLLCVLSSVSAEKNFTNSSDKGTTNNCIAGGSGYGLAFDYTRRADLVSLLWEDIPNKQITVEFWFKNLDPFLTDASLFSYSAYRQNGANGTQMGVPYEAANELSLRVSWQRWNLWRGDGEVELQKATNRKVEESWDGKWHHYAFSVDSANGGSAALYLDGEEMDFGTTRVDLGPSNAPAISYQKVAFSNDWDVAEHPDARDYYGVTQTAVAFVETLCSSETYWLPSFSVKEGARDTSILFRLDNECSAYDQALLAVERGARFVILQLGENSDPTSVPGLLLNTTSHTLENDATAKKLNVPVILVDHQTGQAILESSLVTFTRLMGPADVGVEFGRDIVQGGVLTMGQEPDAPWGDFDPFQAMNGVVDELRVWNVVRTPKQIKDNYKRFIDVDNDPEAVHLNLYYTFDELVEHQKAGQTFVTTRDYSPSGRNNTGLVGALPTIHNEATFNNGDPPISPTQPQWIPTSSAPLVGFGDVVVPVAPGSDTVIELKSFDPDGDDLLTIIVSEPTGEAGLGSSIHAFGHKDSSRLAAGDVVVDIERTESKRVVFRAHPRFSSESTFRYSVQDNAGDAKLVVATVRLIPHMMEVPPSVIETVKEDSLNFFSLAKPSQLTQDNMRVVISTLPPKGRLFQIQFNPEKYPVYSSLSKIVGEYGEMEVISQSGTALNNTRGVVMYAPDENGFSDPAGSVYESIGYKLVDPVSGLESAEAFVDLVVVAENDSPEFDSSSVGEEGLSVKTKEYLVLKLKSVDIDAHTVENFSNKSFARIVQFPRAGLLYQYNESSENKMGGFMDATTKAVPQVFSWASNVVRFSSQFSRCGFACYSWNNPACPTDCTSKDYTAEMVLGPPDAYPNYLESVLGWEAGDAGAGHEWLELEFPFGMYINGLELYEVHKPGTAWKVSTTDNYIDDTSVHCTKAGVPGIPECTQNTLWQTLWSKPREFVVPGSETATIFSPPLCPSTKKTSIIRLDFDTARVAGWNIIDAVKLIGSLEFPPGLVDDNQNRLVYAPRPGVHGTDSVSFEFSDCLSEGRIQNLALTVSPPIEGGEFTSSTIFEEDIFVMSGPGEVGQETIDFSPVFLRIEELLEGDESRQFTAKVWHTTALGIAAGTQFPNIVSSKAPQVAVDLGVPRHTNPPTAIEIWFSHADDSSSLTFRVKYRLHMCEDGVVVRDSDIYGRRACVIENDNLLPKGVRAFGYMATGISWFLSLYFMSWLFRNRKVGFVKVAQIEFLVLICVGAMISSSTLIALSFEAGTGEDTSAASTACAVAPFLYTIGWVLQYSSLGAKTYRLYRIMESHKKGEPETITSWSMFRIVIFAFSVDMAIVIVWTILNPLVYERENVSRDVDVENGLITIQSVGQCRPSEQEPSLLAFFGPLIAFHFLLLVAANVLLLKVRKMKDCYQESKHIMMAMVLMLEILVVGVPLLLAVKDSAAADYGVLVAIIALHDIGILLCTFVPKVMLQKEGPDKEIDHMESIILASFKKLSNSRWDEGIGTLHELLEHGELRSLMSSQQVERLQDVKTLLVQGIQCNHKDSKAMHIPVSLVRRRKGNKKQENSVGFILKEFGGVTTLDKSSTSDFISDDNMSDESRNPTTDNGLNYVLPEFLDLNPTKKTALLEMLSWSALRGWDFNVFDIAKLTDGKPLLFVGWAILGSPHSQVAMANACGQQDFFLDRPPGYKFVVSKGKSALGIHMRTLCDYLRVIEQSYIAENPYHNETHATDVLQATHSILQMAIADRALVVTEEDLFSILLAAVVHDVNHPGMNNAFQIGARTNLAMIYNDASVLENRHASYAFMRMLGVDESDNDSRSRHNELNILKNVSQNEFCSIRSKVVRAILQTDMSNHFQHVSIIKSLVLRYHQEAKQLDKDGTWEILEFILHSADISSQGRPSPMFREWTDRCLDEFFLQGDEEAKRGLPISPNCNRHTTKIPESQVGFINYVVLPTFEVLGMIIPSIKERVVPNIQENLRYWESRTEDSENTERAL